MKTLLKILLLMCIATPALAEVEDLSPAMKNLLEETKFPSLAGAAVKDGKIVGAGAFGLRKQGDDTAVTVEDKYHLGSCTKSMTATLAAILVEDGLLDWDTTVADVFKDIEIHESFQKTTLLHLLSHSGGCPDNVSKAANLKFMIGGKPAVKQRMTVVRGTLKRKPEYTPGSGYLYSNLGYAIAGAMLETLANKPWEDLLREKLFKPLEMQSAGFRAPGDAEKIDQPWGHLAMPIPPSPRADNPDAIGPAGTVHCSIGDWAKYALFHLESKPGKIIKNKETFNQLHKLHNKKGNYALGWMTVEVPGMGRILQHAGSNTMWFSLVWIVPDKNFAAVAVTNSGQDGGFKLCDKAILAMMQKYMN